MLPMYTLPQLEILMLVAESDDPLATALQLRRRWQYIHQVAQGAAQGYVVDSSLPTVIRDHEAYTARAKSLLAVLDEWLDEHREPKGAP